MLSNFYASRKCFPYVICISFLLLCLAVAFSTEKEEAVFASYPVKSVKTIVLDAGHGGEDCGAIGKNGVFEKDLNLLITKELGRQLSELGYEVLYTRKEDHLLYKEEENIKGLRKIYDLKNRVKFASEKENAIFVSIHMNAFSDEKYSGLQVFFSKNHEQSRALANAVQLQVKEKIQPENRRSIKEGTGMYLMENLYCPAILIECGFLSNAEECEKLCEKEYQNKLCFSILCGIISIMEE
ncbi:MAG: N-acetylmuramoyl-L-alanine amidase [Clostridia bacterium]|nr:N-acetylmuramoyl-L-alanine amidase [Clostridia bacterium]